MTDKPVWMESWRADGWFVRGLLADEADGELAEFEDVYDDGDRGGARASLAAAAPSLVRALLLVEWERGGFQDVGSTRYTWTACPRCYERRGMPHKSYCLVDAALTQAGFPNAESRDAARREMETK